MIQPIFRMKGVLRVKIKLIQDAAAAECITHAGTFHADEVFATVILGKVFGSLTLCRVNAVPAEVREGVIVYDIGQGELDHHQRGGNGTRDNGVPYAASGLVWKRYGKRLTERTRDSERVWDMIDRELIQGIDAIDNGVLPQTDHAEKCLNVSDLIRMMNPLWNTVESFDEAFYKAVSLAETILTASMKAPCQRQRRNRRWSWQYIILQGISWYWINISHGSSSYLIRQIQRQKKFCLSYSLPPEAGSIVSVCQMSREDMVRGRLCPRSGEDLREKNCRK